MFASYIYCPPRGVVFDISTPKNKKRVFSLLYAVYNQFGDTKLARFILANIVDPLFFGTRSKMDSNPEVDIIHYLNLVPSGKLVKPYVVEFEHVGALFGFVKDEKSINKVKELLLDDECKAIICSTEAARTTLKKLFIDDYSRVKNKAKVIYPAVCLDQIHVKLIKKTKRKKLKLLFVGEDCFRKGLEELLLALTLVPNFEKKIELTVVSSDASNLINKYSNLKEIIKYFPPNFSKHEILQRFYSKADVFVLPTKRDTFGFAIIDALTCGTPVITTRQFATHEIVDHKKDGLLLQLDQPILNGNIYITRSIAKQMMGSDIDKKLSERLRQCIEDLCNNRYDLDIFASNAVKKVESGGKFSAKKRNQELLKIYKKVTEIN
jgi:glycosyltransferase involved in cell wall biosynthesis